MTVHVLRPGLLSTVQDGGRHGWAALGVGSAGPMDDGAFRLANALAGNPPGAPALEITLIGPRLRFDDAATVALAGADFDARIDGEPLPGWRPVRVGAGAVLDCGRARRGARAWLAIGGGIAAGVVLGSAATDLNARLGPFGGRPLAAGDALPVATPAGAEPSGRSARPSRAAARPHANWSLDARPWFDPDTARPLRLVRGTHFDALDAASRRALFAAEFRIGAESNRVGFRLEGPRLALSAPLEPVSEPLAAGTLQLPPGGQPIALMAEHPTVGGYPRIGHVAAIDLARLAQRRPGDPVRFAPIGLDDAQTRYLERERELARLLDTIATRLNA